MISAVVWPVKYERDWADLTDIFLEAEMKIFTNSASVNPIPGLLDAYLSRLPWIFPWGNIHTSVDAVTVVWCCSRFDAVCVWRNRPIRAMAKHEASSWSWKRPIILWKIIIRDTPSGWWGQNIECHLWLQILSVFYPFIVPSQQYLYRRLSPLLYIWTRLFWMSNNFHGSLQVWAQPMRDEVTM